jgi:hypothetical protein
MHADTSALHRSVAKVANLEGPEEELVAKTHKLETTYLVDLLSGQRRQYSCFQFNVVENAVVRQ